MIDIRKFQSLPPQGTNEWHKLRLGNFNASRISDLMTRGKKKEEIFGKTALAYINEVATERLLAPEVINDDMQFFNYLQLVSAESRAMRYGIEHEHEAREMYEILHGVSVTEVSSIMHPEIPHFSCSSDGLVTSLNSGIEIKCPLPKTYVEYRRNITDAESLKAFKPEYYWQIQAQIDICDLEHVDFVAFCPFMAKAIHEARIVRVGTDIDEMHERLFAANRIIDEIVDDLK